MRDLTEVGEAIRTDLDARHRAREAALEASRRSIRNAANAIRAMHRGERDLAEQLLGEARAELARGVAASAGHGAVRYAGFLTDAEKEVAEAATFVAIVTGSALPAPDVLGVEAAAYANGLAEAIGELRRHLLDVVRDAVGSVEARAEAEGLARSEALLEAMDDIHAVLVTMDFPDGVTGGLRRSTDVARSIIERTRGDLTTTLVQANLRTALETHRRQVLEA